MGFFTRIPLSDDQIKQLSGDTLTLSGTTNFIGTLKSKDVEIDANVDTSSVGDVLTWDGNKIVLNTGSTGIYDGLSPVVVEEAVGGIDTGYVLSNKTYTQILQDMLVQTLSPILTAPSNTFSSQSSPLEVGCVPSLSFTAGFNQGSINPQYTATCDKRSNCANQYNYTGTDLPTTFPSTLNSDVNSVTTHTIVSGTAGNTWSSSVSYDGGVQPKNSDGTDYSTPLPSGTTGAISRNINGIYPIYYGKLASAGRPAVTNALVIAGTKSLVCSTSTVTVDFNSSTSEYTWMAMPQISASKSCWFVNALDNGLINSSPSDKYPDECVISITSAEGCWAAVNYKVYMSGTVGQITDPLQFRNS